MILLLQKLCALIVEHHLCSQDEIDSCILLVTHNGAPAQLIGGQTLDSVINSFSPAASLENVFLGGVRLIIVEECSSVHWWKLALLSIGFCHPKSGGSGNYMNPFDGVSVVAVYDVCQLGPVKDSNIFCSLREFEIILSKSHRAYGGIISQQVARSVEKLVWNEFGSPTGSSEKTRHNYQAPRVYFAANLVKIYRNQDEDGIWPTVTENLRGGSFSQSDMNSVSVRDICFGGNDNASKSKQEAFRNTVCHNDRFRGQKPLFLASSHAALAGLSNLFYAYNQKRADSLKWFCLYGNIPFCLALGELVHFLSPIAGTPVKNGTQGRIVGWAWKKQALSNKKSGSDNDDDNDDDFYYDDYGDDDDNGSFGIAENDVLDGSDDSSETNPPNNNSNGEDLSTSSLFSLGGLYSAPDILYIALTCVPSAVQEKYSD